MFVLDEKLFEAGLKIFQIPIEWFRQVSRFLNQLCGGTGIRVSRPSVPSSNAPVEISIDEEWLDEKIGSAETEDTTEASTPAAPTLAADDDSADFTAGGDTLSDGDAIDTTNYPDAENDTLRWMNNAAANALGSYDADNDTPSGAWLTPTTLEALDPFDPNAQTGDEVVFNHHKALNLLIFARSKECGEDELHFARWAQIDATGRLRYTGAEVCISRALKKAVLNAQSVLRSIVATSSGGNRGVVDLNNTSYNDWDQAFAGIAAAATVPFPDQASAISGVVWRAGHGEGYEEAIVSRIVPFWVDAGYGYIKIFTHVKRYSPSGLLYEVADEVDTGLALQNLMTAPV